jgi:hypothetical protein
MEVMACRYIRNHAKFQVPKSWKSGRATPWHLGGLGARLVVSKQVTFHKQLVRTLSLYCSVSNKLFFVTLFAGRELI